MNLIIEDPPEEANEKQKIFCKRINHFLYKQTDYYDACPKTDFGSNGARGKDEKLFQKARHRRSTKKHHFGKQANDTIEVVDGYPNFTEKRGHEKEFTIDSKYPDSHTKTARKNMIK